MSYLANALGGVLLAGMAPIFMLAAIGLLLTVPIFAYQPTIVSSQFDTTGLAQHSQATIISADANGAFVAGYINVTGSAGRYFVGHFDQSGRLEWSHRFGVEGDSVRSISAGGMGVYVVGFVNGSSVLAQFSNGNQLWTRPLGTANGYVSSVNGNAFVAGYESVTIFNTGGTILRTSSGLQLPGNLIAASADSSGFYILTSNGLEKLNLDGSELWTSALPQCSMFGPADARSLAVAGGMEFVDDSSCLIEYNSSAKLIWYTPITCADQSSGQQSWISADSANVYAIMSSNNGPSCLAKYDYSGNQVSGVNLPREWRVSSISTGEGATYVAGAIGSMGQPTVLVARLGFANDLILLGLHSPFSYLLVAVVLGLVGLGVFRYRRRRRSHPNRVLVEDYRFDGPVD